MFGIGILPQPLDQYTDTVQEKGRITYYVMVGVVCGLGGGASVVLGKEISQHMALDSVLLVLLLIVAGIYALSWYLSVVFFQKREI